MKLKSVFVLIMVAAVLFFAGSSIAAGPNVDGYSLIYENSRAKIYATVEVTSLVTFSDFRMTEHGFEYISQCKDENLKINYRFYQGDVLVYSWNFNQIPTEKSKNSGICPKPYDSVLISRTPR
ncbi:MAG: hypothetical protein ABFD98_05035 [Syntrophobacteraceae bacterium]